MRILNLVVRIAQVLHGLFVVALSVIEINRYKLAGLPLPALHLFLLTLASVSVVFSLLKMVYRVYTLLAAAAEVAVSLAWWAAFIAMSQIYKPAECHGWNFNINWISANQKLAQNPMDETNTNPSCVRTKLDWVVIGVVAASFLLSAIATTRARQVSLRNGPVGKGQV